MLSFLFAALSETASQWLGGVVIGALLLLAYLVATHWSRGKQ
jgi:hypothetical protein